MAYLGISCHLRDKPQLTVFLNCNIEWTKSTLCSRQLVCISIASNCDFSDNKSPAKGSIKDISLTGLTEQMKSRQSISHNSCSG